MATSRNVWLPGAAVWACLPNLSEPLSSSAPAHLSLKSKNARCHDRERHDDDLPEKRRKAAVNPSASSDSAPEVEKSPNKLDRLDTEEANAPDLLLTTESKEVTMCAICLGNIEESRGAVLKWCMHQFCTHCIEEWSRVRRLCPLCKAEYHGWYYGVQSISKFEERILPPIAELSTRENNTAAASQAFSRVHVRRDFRRQGRGRGRMPPRRQGEAAPSSSRRSDPFPTQRTFGLPRQYQGAEAMRVLEEQAAAKALQWRQSIYNRNLIARPFELRKELTGTKDAEAERRLEPWVRRELQAVLPNSDHDFLVRLVLGLWFRARNQAMHIPETPGTSAGPAENFLAKAMKELKQFLGDNAEVFWHELRCFAESPFTMQAYDTVVVYNRRDMSRRPLYKVERKSAIATSTSMPLHNEDTARLENNHEIVRVGRHTVSHTCAVEGVRSSLVQQQQDSDRDRPQALPTSNFRADQQKNVNIWMYFQLQSIVGNSLIAKS